MHGAAAVHRIMPTLRPATIPASADAPSKHRDQGTKEFYGAGIMARISEAARGREDLRPKVDQVG